MRIRMDCGHGEFIFQLPEWLEKLLIDMSEYERKDFLQTMENFLRDTVTALVGQTRLAGKMGLDDITIALKEAMQPFEEVVRSAEAERTKISQTRKEEDLGLSPEFNKFLESLDTLGIG